MRQRVINIITPLILICGILLLIIMPGCTKKIEPFSIIYTSNLRGNALPSMIEQVSTHQPVHHFSQTMEIIGRLKAGESRPVILADSGNCLVGYDDFSFMFNGAPMIDLFKLADYDVVMLGDDRGVDFSKINIEEPFLACGNASKKVSFVTKDMSGLRVAFYGLIEPISPKSITGYMVKINIPSKSESMSNDRKSERRSISGGISPDPNISLSRSDSKKVRDINEQIKNTKSDFNILLCRVNDIEKTVKELRGVDLVIPGRYHDTLKSREVTFINNVPVAPFVDSRFNIGKIDIESAKQFKCRIVPAGGADMMPSKKVIKVLQPYILKFRERYPDNYGAALSSGAAFGTEDMIHPLKSADESPTANFIADIIRNATGADITIINNRAIRKDLRGIITISRLREVLIFENELVTMNLTGDEIENILNSNAIKGGTIYRFSGIVLGADPDKGGTMALYQGKPLDKGKIYRVATLDYLVNSDKFKYEIFKKGRNRKFTGIVLNNVVLDHLSRYPYITAPPARTLTDDAFNEEMLSRFYKNGMKRGEESVNPDLVYGIAEYGRKKYGKALEYFNKLPYPGKFFAAMSLFRMGKTIESKELFTSLSKKYADSFPLRKIAASFPDESPVEGEKPKGSVRWATFKGDYRRTGRSKYSGGSTGDLQWKFRTHHTIQSSPSIGHGGVVYCAAGDGFLYAITPEGMEKWKLKLGKVLLASPTISKHGIIYVGSDKGVMYAISHTGKVVWKYKTGGWIKSTAAIGDDGSIYFGSDDKHFYAFTPKGKLKWKVKLGDEVFSSPAIDADGNTYVGSVDRHLYCISSRGKIKWKFGTKGKIFSTPGIADDGTIYFGSDDSFVYALTPDGGLKWKLKTGGFVPSSPAVGKDGSVYIGSEDGYFYALAPDGRERWKFKTDYEIFGSPVIDREGNIFFGSDDTWFYALTPGGKLLWKFRTGKYIESSPAIGPDGTIYFGADDGFVYAVR